MAASKERPTAYEVGDVRIDARAAQVRKNGVLLHLEPKAFQTLLFLVERPGELVSKQELLDAVWQDAFVTENALTRVVAQLRKALDDDAREARYIETVPTLGYRFVAPVRPVVSPTATRFRRRAIGLGAAAAGVLALVVASNLDEVGPHAIDSLAVLPLENLSADPEQAFFTDGMTEALTARLAQIKTLKVISSTSVMTYKDEPRKALAQIAKELDVDAVIQGSVLRAGDRVRITVQLVDAASGRHLWAESYEGDLQDVLSLQGDVARAIVREVEVELTQEESAILARARPVDPEAHDDYLRGRFYMSEAKGGRFERAVESFDRAIEKDPDFALAYAAKAYCYFGLGAHGHLPPLDAMAKAKELAARALALDPTLDDAHVVLGWLALSSWNWAEAEQAMENAIRLNPNSSPAHEAYAWYLSVMGRHDEAIDRAKRAVRLNPIDLGPRATLARFYFHARRYDRAVEELKEILQVDPDFVLAYTILEWVYVRRGMYDDALAAKREELRRIGTSSEEISSLQDAYARSGVRGYWAWKLDFMLKRTYFRSSANEVLAGHYMSLGELDRAFELLEQAYAEHDPFLFTLGVNPWWDPVRSDPRFQDIVERLKFPSRG